MTTLDLIVLLFMGSAGAFGFMRGLVTEALSLMAWVVAVISVRLFHGPVSSALEAMLGTATGASLLATLLVFGLTMFLGRRIARHMGDKTKNSGLGAFDRVLGLGFGAAKGLLLVAVGFVFISLIYNVFWGATAPRPDWMKQSRTYPLLDASARAITGFVRDRNSSPAPKGKAA
jgi:membrane protein required for colicin V production